MFFEKMEAVEPKHRHVLLNMLNKLIHKMTVFHSSEKKKKDEMYCFSVGLHEVTWWCSKDANVTDPFLLLIRNTPPDKY